jgi:hypothetical protein
MGAFKDFSGQRIGALTVLDRGTNDKSGRPQWRCRCDCGNETLVKAFWLSKKTSTSCGCGMYRNTRLVKDLAGQRFGRLLAVEPAYSKPNGGVFWRCRCDCGNETVVRGAKLNNGHTQSCGCIRREMMTTHGHTGNGKNRKPSPTYSSWANLIARCTYVSATAYEHYKKRDITLCDRWRTFENFLADMGERPEGTTLDRVENDKGYFPGNCRWATKQTQANNRVTNIHFVYKDTRYTLAELARATGVAKETLRCRLVRPGGWDVEAAVETPVMSRQERGRRRFQKS